jgi:hypothetical protein
MAANAEQFRHVMTQTFSERYNSRASPSWLHAGGNLSRHNYVDQCTDRPLLRRQHLPKCHCRFPRLFAQPSRSRRIAIAHTVAAGVKFKSPSRSLPDRRTTSRDFVPWRSSDAGHLVAWLVPCFPASDDLHRKRHMQCSKRARHSITSSARASALVAQSSTWGLVI